MDYFSVISFIIVYYCHLPHAWAHKSEKIASTTGPDLFGGLVPCHIYLGTFLTASEGGSSNHDMWSFLLNNLTEKTIRMTLVSSKPCQNFIPWAGLLDDPTFQWFAQSEQSSFEQLHLTLPVAGSPLQPSCCWM